MSGEDICIGGVGGNKSAKCQKPLIIDERKDAEGAFANCLKNTLYALGYKAQELSGGIVPKRLLEDIYLARLDRGAKKEDLYMINLLKCINGSNVGIVLAKNGEEVDAAKKGDISILREIR